MTNKLKVKIIIFDLITIFIFSTKISFSYGNCDLNTPIKKDGECQLIFCTEEEYKNKDCLIDNDIIKTQWLNNIIKFDDNKYRYCSIALNSKGDMIAEFSEEENNGKRLFYGLKQDGHYFFKNLNNTETSTKIVLMQKDNEFSIRYKSENFFVFLNNSNDYNDFLMSISIYIGNVELYDFESNVESFVKTIEFTGYLIYSFSNALIKLNGNDNNYLFISVGQRKDDCVDYQNFYLVLQIYSFSKKNININDGYQIEKSYEMTVSAFRAVSGYTSDSNLIVIFYFYNTYNIATFNYNLEKLLDNPISQEINLDFNSRNIGLFLKCIYLKGDLGVFSYFLSSYDSGPIIKIEKISIDNVYFDEMFYIPITLELYKFHSEPRLSDLIKINDNRFTFVTSSYDKTMLFILLYDLYNNDNNLKMRMYRILLNLYNIEVFNEITTSLYNNYLVISLSVCNSLNNQLNYFSLLMILNYVNGTDSFIDISPYLIENINDNGDNIKGNLIDKLQEKITIDNNIFGYELVNEIKLIDFPSVLYFYNLNSGVKLLLDKNEILGNEHEIGQIENCLKNGEDIYFIEYQFIVKEPSYEQFNLYPILIFDYPEGAIADQANEFEEKTFYSRVNKVSFKLCNEKCEQCYYLGTSNNPKCFSNIEEKTNEKTYLSSQCMEIEYLENSLKVMFSSENKFNLDNNIILQEIIKNIYFSDNIIDELDQITNGGDDITITTDNFIIQITSTYNQKNSKNHNISTINLGQCEILLKDAYHIYNRSLLILKIDTKIEGLKIPDLQYKVYHPVTKKPLNLNTVIRGTIRGEQKIFLFFNRN